MESGGSDAGGERASARARREARLATLTGRAEEENSGRDYKKVGPGPLSVGWGT